MPTKTITLDVEAYKLLKQLQKERESFSQTIKRVIRPKPTVESWLARVARVQFSEEFVSAVERQVRSRAQRSRRPSETR